MSDQGNNEPPALSPAFATLLKKANTVALKPNFGARNPTTKPNIGLFKPNDGNSLTLSRSGSLSEGTSGSTPVLACETLESQKTKTPVLACETLESQKTKTGGSSPFANLMNKNKEMKQGFGSSSLEKISAKYLNKTDGATPKFGSASSAIACPIFSRDISHPVDVCNAIRPLTSQEIQIPVSSSCKQDLDNILSTSAGSNEFGSPSSSTKFTFTPIPCKTQSPCVPSTSPLNQDSKISSLNKLKDRYVKNTRMDNTRTFADDSPSPSQGRNGFKRFNFDLSSALVTRKPTDTPVTPNMKKTPPLLRHTQEHTIVVDQLACMSDARTLVGLSSRHNSVAFKRMSNMGRVICKKWKAGTCENIPLHYKPPYHIPAFKFDSMSPDDEIQSKFKRRR